MDVDVKVIPRASHSQVIGTLADGTLKVKVNAAPERGKANAELVKLLARHFGVAASRVEIVSGQTSSRKRVRISP